MSALVTGASGGLGRAIALALAAAGHDVIVHWRSDRDGAQETVRLVAETGRRAYAVCADLAIAGAAELDRAAADLVAQSLALLGDQGGLDVVVLNAFPQDITAWDDLDTAAWDVMLDGGLRPTAALLRASGTHLIHRAASATAGDAASGGVIITIGSIEGLRPAPGHTAYAVTKAALHHLTAAAAHELGSHGIRVVGVAPGLIGRPGLERDWPDGIRRWEKASALGRPVSADEIAAVVDFLASPAASAVTGVTIPVDAGWSAAPGW